MTLPCQKHFFEIPDDVIYLNCSYLAPMFDEIKKAGIEGVMRKKRPWAIKPKDFFEESAQVKQLFAKIVNAQAQDIAIVPAVSYGIGVAANNILSHAQQNVIVLEEQFPSNIYPWRSKNAKIITVQRPVNHDWTQGILEAINEDTAVVAVPQCHWTDGSFVDLNKSVKKSAVTNLIPSQRPLMAVSPCQFESCRMSPNRLGLLGLARFLIANRLRVVYVA